MTSLAVSTPRSIGLDEPVEAVLEPDDLDAVVDAGLDDGADDGVQAGSVAAPGEHADSLQFCHGRCGHSIDVSVCEPAAGSPTIR